MTQPPQPQSKYDPEVIKRHIQVCRNALDNESGKAFLDMLAVWCCVRSTSELTPFEMGKLAIYNQIVNFKEGRPQ